MRTKTTLLLILTLFAAGCRFSETTKSAELISQLKISQPPGVKASIPLGEGITVVNLFDDFCTECPTGTRFHTMEHLNSLRSGTTKVFVVFSEKHFSTQDVENFKVILSMPDSLVQGDIEAMKPYLIKGKLLAVFDSTGSVVWQEKPYMSEEDVLTEVSQLIKTANN